MQTNRFRILLPAMVLAALTGCQSGPYEVARFKDQVITSESLLREMEKNAPSSLSDTSFTERGVNEFLDRYIVYRLKVLDGQAKGFHQDSVLLQEFAQYKRTLAQNRVMDGAIKKNLIEELYSRRQKMMHASHILIQYNPSRGQGDSTVPWLRINGILKEIKNGLSFEEAARKHSEDPSAKQNGGDLGWFTGGDMVYPFENAVYNSVRDSVIGPIRTSFGYHLIKVHGEKPSSDPRYISHIMLMFADDKDSTVQRTVIDSAYQLIVKGDSFDRLVQELSEDFPSKQNKGSMGEWKPSGRVPEFDHMIFDVMKSAGEISPVVKTRWGYHIIRLDSLGKRPTLDQEYENLSRIVSRQTDRLDSRKAQLFKELTPKNKINVNRSVLKAVSASAALWKAQPKDSAGVDIPLATALDSVYQSTVLSSSEGVLTVNGLITWGEGRGMSSRFTKSAETNEKLIEQFLTDYYIEEYINHLDKYDPEFVDILASFKDGLVLFKWMENELWQPAVPSDEELTAIRKETPEQYQWPERGKFAVLSIRNFNHADSLVRFPVVKPEPKPAKGKKGKTAPVKPWSPPATFDELVNLMSDNNLIVALDTLVVAPGDGEDASRLWGKPFNKVDLSLVFINNRPSFVFFLDKVPAAPKSLDEARADLTRIYNERLQRKREVESIENLKKNASIQINQEAVKRFVSDKKKS
ncbi:MAG: peptidylprolyl isomerase [Bacteroidetes bacterium]|nr:peptidylprolyl isomerase [Bacteroidota bacterium]